MEVSIELQDGVSLSARDLYETESPADFIKTVQQDGGLFLPEDEGTQPFVPYASIQMFWFYDSIKDLTVN